MEPQQYPYFNFARLQLASERSADKDAIIDAFLYQPGNLDLIKQVSGLAEEINRHLQQRTEQLPAAHTEEPVATVVAFTQPEPAAENEAVLPPPAEEVTAAEVAPVIETMAEPPADPVVMEASAFELNLDDRYPFEEWLQILSGNRRGVVAADADGKDETATGLQLEIPLDYVHHLVEKEANYSIGLDEFVAAQISSRKNHRRKERKQVQPEIFATETMARIYEEQKLFAKAIEIYEALSVKHPEKSASFAARILELKKEL